MSHDSKDKLNDWELKNYDADTIDFIKNAELLVDPEDPLPPAPSLEERLEISRRIYGGDIVTKWRKKVEDRGGELPRRAEVRYDWDNVNADQRRRASQLRKLVFAELALDQALRVGDMAVGAANPLRLPGQLRTPNIANNQQDRRDLFLMAASHIGSFSHVPAQQAAEALELLAENITCLGYTGKDFAPSDKELLEIAREGIAITRDLVLPPAIRLRNAHQMLGAIALGAKQQKLAVVAEHNLYGIPEARDVILYIRKNLIPFKARCVYAMKLLEPIIASYDAMEEREELAEGGGDAH